ncbi:MAG: hypothetical protein ACRERE_07915 [Candidatus Entotheonellia bacterium]
MTPEERRALFAILPVAVLAPLIGAQGAVDGQALRERFDQCLV